MKTIPRSWRDYCGSYADFTEMKRRVDNPQTVDDALLAVRIEKLVRDLNLTVKGKSKRGNAAQVPGD